MSVRDLTILGCSAQQPTRDRNHGAYLLRWNEEGLLFDPGEGTQRQFIFAEIAPPVVTRIFVSHFHGDHCLGVGSMLMRLNLDKVKHPIHCYYPASGKKNFDALRYGCLYHENIDVVEHPVSKEGVVQDDENFRIEAVFLDHGVDNIGWRVTEPDTIKFNKAKLKEYMIQGPDVRKLQDEGVLLKDGKKIRLEEVSWVRQGDSFVYVADTRYIPKLISFAKGAKMLLCESTYLEEHSELAFKHQHMTAKQAATLAKEAQVHQLILTHYSARYPESSVFETEAKTIFPNSFAVEDLQRFEFSRE